MIVVGADGAYAHDCTQDDDMTDETATEPFNDDYDYDGDGDYYHC